MISVEETLDCLARAFGGKSQYTMDTVGQALAGQANNSCAFEINLKSRVEQAAVILEEYWDECADGEFLIDIERGVVIAAIGSDNPDLLQDWG